MRMVVLACAAMGFTDCIARGGVGVTVDVIVGGKTTVAVADGRMVVGVGGPGVAVTTTTMGVGDGTVTVAVGDGVSVTGVILGRGVKEAISVDTGVRKIGAPTSLQPRSGAPPVYTIGLGGTNSPLLAVY